MQQSLSTCRVDAGPLLHMSAARKGALLLVGGPQALVTVELLSQTRDGDEHQYPVFNFDKRRHLWRQDTRGGSRAANIGSCTGVAFQPGSDVFAASCSAHGYISLWDTVAKQSEPLIKQWQGHMRNATGVTFLPVTPGMATSSLSSSSSSASSNLVSAAGDGTLHLWKLKLGDFPDMKQQELDAHETQEVWHPGVRQSSAPAASSMRDADLSGDSSYEKLDLRPAQHGRSGVRDLHAQPHGDGAQLLVAQDNGRVSIYNLGDFSCGTQCGFQVSFKHVLSARFHPHIPSLFAAAAQDQVVRILDMRENDHRACASVLRAGAVGSIRWRPDRPEQIASCGLDTMSGSAGSGLLVWDLRRPFVPLHRFKAHGDVVPDFFWADTNHLISCGRDSTVQLHSVLASEQPQAATRCSGASWSAGRGFCEALAVVADAGDREAEPGNNPLEALQNLVEATRHRGFEADAGLARRSEYEALATELREHHEHIRCCGLFSTATPGCRSEEEQRLWELTCLPPFRQEETEATASQLCTKEAERCLKHGLTVRAQTWRLLSKVLGGDVPPETLIASALMDKEQQADQCAEENDTSQTVRGLGAKLVLHYQAPSLLSGSMSPLGRSVGARSALPSSPISYGSFGGRTTSASSSFGTAEPREQLVATTVSSWQQMWRVQTLRHIIEFHEERNDVGMLLALVATLGVGPNPEPMLRRKILRWAQGAADVLSRFQAFVPRAALLRAVPFQEVQELKRGNTRIYLQCVRMYSRGAETAFCGAPWPPSRGLCAQPLRRVPSAGSTPAARTGSKMSARAQPCQKCNRRRTPPCAICGEEVRGLWAACQVCGHGGHMRHIREWFAGGHRACPAGCGHLCAPPGPAKLGAAQEAPDIAAMICPPSGGQYGGIALPTVS